MKRTINYTGRRSILDADARITLVNQADGAWSFEASIGLADYGLPSEAKVYVEAYRQTRWMRFEWGTVGAPTPTPERRLSEFESPEDVLFRVKVVGAAPAGQLLAAADQLRPLAPGEVDADRIPLLPVKPEDLGEEAWKVEIDRNSTRLLVNSAFGDVHAVSLSPEFRALVYPMALRIILTEALCVRDERGELSSESDPGQWQSRWVRFCQRLPGVDGDGSPFDLNDFDQRVDWIDEAVRAFCRKHGLLQAISAICKEGQ